MCVLQKRGGLKADFSVSSYLRVDNACEECGFAAFRCPGEWPVQQNISFTPLVVILLFLSSAADPNVAAAVW